MLVMPSRKSAEEIILESLENNKTVDEHGLNAEQRTFLRKRKTTLDDLEAFDLAKINRATFEGWMIDPAFESAYREQVPKSGLQTARDAIDSLLPTAISILQKALQGEDLTKQQMRAVDMLLKVGGLQRIYLEVQQLQIPAEAVIALAMMRRGELPPPQMAELVESFFPDEYKKLALTAGDIIEGEVRIVEER